MIERSRNLHEQGLAVVAGYSALLPPVMLFCSRHQSVRDFQIKDQQVKWAQPIQMFTEVLLTGGRQTERRIHPWSSLPM